MVQDFVLFLNFISEKVFCFVLFMKKHILNKYTQLYHSGMHVASLIASSGSHDFSSTFHSDS